MGKKTIFTCDCCGKEIEQGTSADHFGKCGAVHVEYDITVTGFVSGGHSTGHFNEEEDMLFCRQCFDQNIRGALRALGITINAS